MNADSKERQCVGIDRQQGGVPAGGGGLAGDLQPEKMLVWGGGPA
jgi:hypothetical protein